jgi:ankyrin repeat protein
MFAAGEGQLEVVRTLLRHGADRAARDADGDAAIDHALRRRHSEVVALLDRPGAAQAGGTPR